MRVLHVAPCFVSLEQEAGGVANVVRQLALRQAEAGADVTVYCGTRELGRIVGMPGAVTAGPRLRIRAFAQHAAPAIGPARELRSALATAGVAFDVAHVHTCFSWFTESAMLRLAHMRVPFVFSPHGKLSAGMRRKRGRLKSLWWVAIGRRATQQAARVFALAASEAESILAAGIDVKSELIPNGFERPTANQDGPAPYPGPYILFLGYLDPRKQPELLIDAFAASRCRATHVLVFVGPDSYRLGDSLRARARTAGVAERVMFAGPAFGATKWSYLDHATCLCLPSLGEGLPVVLCEALGAGLPSVYSRECNFPEIAAAQAGVQLEAVGVDAWAAAIDRIAGDPVLRSVLSANALDLSRQFGWDNVAKRTLATYACIIDEAREAGGRS